MAEKHYLSHSEYTIRTTSYYLSEGGSYSNLISILTRLRQSYTYRRLAPPAKVLNEACYTYDSQLRDQSAEKQAQLIMAEKDCVMRYVVAALAANGQQGTDVMKLIRKKLEANKTLYTEFAPLFPTEKAEQGNVDLEMMVKTLEAILNQREEELKKSNHQAKALADEAKAKDSIISDLRNIIGELQDTIEHLKEEAPDAASRVINLDSILSFAERAKHYHYTYQIYDMVKSLLAQAGMTEEYRRVQQHEDQMKAANPPILQNINNINNSNVLQGCFNDPQFPIGVNPAEEYLNKNK